MDEPFPDTVDSLLAALDKQYPPIRSDLHTDLASVNRKSGQRSVIDHLRAWKAHQESL